ncbi:MAG TPA: hypothetical protein VNK43_03935 [Gemmatimonadales bacterium]|nr:hypothetical protein [Gemmatimonadales bacterium]
MSLLEAIRNLDTPVEDGLEELAEEVVVKRLGLSRTVAEQIGRYQRAVRQNGRVPFDEAVSVFRLVGRRMDAQLAFADAGRRAARHAARASALPLRALVSSSPQFLSRRVGFRAAAGAASRIFKAELRLREAMAEATMTAPLSIAAIPDGQGCTFYGAAFSELLRCLVGFEGSMAHEECLGRGGQACRWRATAVGDYE